MSRFVLTAQLQLQAPRNVSQVVNQIQRQLNGVNVNLNVQGGRQATRQIAQVNQQVNNLNKGAKNLGKNFGVSIKRFAAFSIANRAVSLFANKLSSAVEDSIDFQRELIKIKQVSGATTQALSNLTSTITDLSTGLGTSSKDLLATSRILAQTGLQAAQLEVALSALAKTTLAPTFESIEKTAEGAVAILAQFGRGVGALEGQLGSINAVAGQFAVESGDLISAVRRTGGVFKSAGGDLNELLALFTSVRATTRESAESIATGLRTIFTRIQRPKTIEFLKQYGVELTNLEGKFVGPFDAVRQLSQSLQGLEEGDIRFVQIAEELGGFRQIGKVIPLIQQFETAERARAAAVAGSTSLDRDAQTAQEALAVQIQKTRENFLALIRSLSETTSFQVLVKTTLGLADALIKVADALKPIVPLLGAFAGIKIAKGIGSFAGGLRGAIGRNAGGPIGLARGGIVPGTGNRDTVPAMLTPGEFVIRKSSVKSLGADTLARMNNNRYADAGKVKPDRTDLGKLRGGEEITLAPSKLGKFKKALLRKAGDKDGDTELDIGGAFLQPEGVIQSLRSEIQGTAILAEAKKLAGASSQDEAKAFLNAARTRGGQFSIPMSIKSGSLSQDVSSRFRSGIQTSLSKFSKGFTKQNIPGIKFSGSKFRKAFQTSNREQIEGGIFESFINGLSDKPFDNQKINPNDVFDFRGGLGSASKAFSGLGPDLVTDAKRTFSTEALASLTKKGGNLILENITGQLAKSLLEQGPSKIASVQERREKLAAGDQLAANRTKKASGGSISGSDTVPALLTPGEFVFNKSAAQSIGYGNLSRMNSKGVQGFAAGGPVGSVQKFANGGRVDPTALAFLLPTVIDSMIPTVEKTDEAISELGTTSIDFRDSLTSLVTQVGIAGVAMSSFGINLKGLGKLFTGGKARSNKRFGQLSRGFQSGNLSNADFDEFMDAREARRSRRSAPARASRAVRGRLGGGRLAGGIGRAAGGAVKAFGAVARFAGPVGIAAGGLFALNKVIGAGLGLQEKFNNAVKLGNVERAKELAVLKEAPAFISLFGEGAAEAYVNLASAFGGNSLESIKANAKAQALAGRTARDFEKNSKAADQALRELKAGTKSAADAFASGELTANLRNTLNQGAAELQAAQANYNNELNRFAGGIRDFIARNLGLGSTDAELEEVASAKREKERQATFDNTSKALDALSESTKINNRQIILSGGTFDESIDRIKSGLDGANLELTLSAKKAEELGNAFLNQQKEIISNLKIAKALNSSLFTLDSTLKGLNVGLADSVAKARGEFNQLSSTLNQLEAVTKGAALDQREFRNNLIGLGKTLSDAGVDRRIIRGVQDQFRDLNNITNDFGNALNKVRTNESFSGNPTAFLKALQSELKNSVDTNTFRNLLDDDKIFEGLGLGEVGKDISEISKELIQRLAKGATVDLEVVRQLETAFEAQAKILKEVAKTEKDLLNVRLASVDSEIRGAELLEEFGVKTFTISQRLELLNKKLQINLGEKVSASAESLSAALSTAGSNLEEQTKALSDADDAKARQQIINEIDKERANIDRLNSSINDRIAIEKEALKVARDKLKLDQQAIDSLLSGNIEDFLRQQEAAAARRALISGNAAAAGNFSPRALGEALKTITDVDQRRTAAQTGVAGGLLSQSMAQIMTENTTEIVNLRNNVRELVDVQNRGASATEAAAKALKDNADKQFESSKREREESKKNLIKNSEKQAAANELLGNKIATQETALKENTNAIEEFTESIRKEREAERLQRTIEASNAKRAVETPEQLAGGAFGSATSSLSKKEKQELNTVRRAAEKIQAGTDQRTPFQAGFSQFRYSDIFKFYGLFGYSRGGPVYASNGMFVPRGTDTVPAMLTPGEFVVNRRAVNTGNNRQILEQMNGGSSLQNGVYYNNGGEVAASVDTKALSSIASSLSSSFGKFNETVNRLINFKFEMTLAPTRVDVVVNTPQAMDQMSSQAKEQILTAVVNEISINQLGKLRRNRNA